MKLHLDVWPIKTKKLIIGIVVLIALIVILVVSVLLLESKKPSAYYHKQLSQLNDTIKTIGPTVELTDKSSHNIAGNIGSYDKLMTRITDTCRPFISQEQEFSRRTQDKKVLEVISNSKKLCTDLTAVAVYSQSVYRGSKKFIELDTNLPAVDTPEFSRRLQELSVTIQKSKSNLSTVDASKLRDPGLQELITHLDDANKQAILIKASLDFQDYSSAGQQKDQLAKMLNEDKLHFLSARSYFWNNTIGLDSLQKAIQKLQTQTK